MRFVSLDHDTKWNDQIIFSKLSEYVECE